MDNMASRQAGRVFSVFIVRGGVKHSEPLERVRAPGMPAMIRRIGRKLREAEGQGYVQRPVLANQQTFQQQAYVVLDEQLGNYLLITAQEQGNEFTPDIVTEGQPVVQHNLQIDEGDGADVLLEDAELSQNVPSALGEEGEGEHKEGGKKSLSEVQVKRVCAKLGLSASKIESKILDGEEVRVGTAALQLNDNGDVVFYRGKRGRVASLMDLDVVIKDFMALAAAQAVKGRKASKKGGTYQIRPLFTVGCGNCRYLGEYLMPDRPENVRCASCGWVTPSEAVAIQLESRQASAFPGYVITTSIPGPKKNRKLNAKRMLKAIKQVVPTDGAKIRSGSLEVVARGVGDAELNRVRRVLEDVFGARDIVAQQAPAVNMMGQPTQHAQTPMAPQPQQPAQPMGPSVQPVQPVQPGAGMQQATMEQYADPTDGVPAVQPAQIQAQRLPVGPGIKHVLVQYEDGRQLWQPVEAANEQMARAIIGSYMDGTQVVQVVDSQLRAAQMDMAPPGGAPMEADPAEQMGLEMTGPGGGENIETASLDQQTEETIKAAMLHYRNTGVGIAEATDSFVNNYSKFLDRYGDKTSPARHLIEAAVIRIAKEIYEKPALVQQPPQFTARLRAELEQARQKHNWHVREARRLQAEEAKGPSPKKINEQQDDWVNLPGGGEMLGPDSETQEGYSDPKVNTQVDTISKQPGSEGADTSTEPGTDSRDPGDFDAGKGYDADGHVTFDGPGWGQSWSDTGMGSDSQTGDNETTSSMDGVADGAYSNVRSK
jgi:hypothetical protein